MIYPLHHRHISRIIDLLFCHVVLVQRIAMIGRWGFALYDRGGRVCPDQCQTDRSCGKLATATWRREGYKITITSIFM